MGAWFFCVPDSLFIMLCARARASSVPLHHRECVTDSVTAADVRTHDRTSTRAHESMYRSAVRVLCTYVLCTMYYVPMYIVHVCVRECVLCFSFA